MKRSKTYARHDSPSIEYRDYKIESKEFYALYLRTSGRGLRYQWCILHPTQRGRYMKATTLEDAKKIIDQIHSGKVAW